VSTIEPGGTVTGTLGGGGGGGTSSGGATSGSGFVLDEVVAALNAGGGVQPPPGAIGPAVLHAPKAWRHLTQTLAKGLPRRLHRLQGYRRGIRRVGT
jgi:hypothetical protein